MDKLPKELEDLISTVSERCTDLEMDLKKVIIDSWGKESPNASDIMVSLITLLKSAGVMLLILDNGWGIKPTDEQIGFYLHFGKVSLAPSEAEFQKKMSEYIRTIDNGEEADATMYR